MRPWGWFWDERRNAREPADIRPRDEAHALHVGWNVALMDQRDEAASGEHGTELSDEALALLEVAIEEADGCFPCGGGGLPTQDGHAG